MPRHHFHRAFVVSASIAAVGLPGAQAQEAFSDATGWRVDVQSTLQIIHERSHLRSEYGGGDARKSAGELRVNIGMTCEQEWCRGTRVVLKPRLWLGDEDVPAFVPSQRPDGFAEAYAIMPLESVELGAGKRLVGWGPSMLYSPTNRLFPDNGAMSPRREIPGKPMASAAFGLGERGRVSLIVADPRLDDVAAIDSDGVFGLARAEWNWFTEHVATLGTVVAGGGGFEPYLGGYFQYGLGEAWTLGAEFAASKGYATSDPDLIRLSQNDREWTWDGTIGVRYGFASGAEIGLEFIYNGYALSDQELQNPAIAAWPSNGSKPSRNRPLHPFVQERYALLQSTWPKLFGDRRWGLTARLQQGLDASARDAFLELSYSPTDATTFFLGYSHSSASRDLAISRPVEHSGYAAFEIHF